MADAVPLTTASVARVLQQRRLAPEVHESRRDPRIAPNIARYHTRSSPETCQFLGSTDMRGCRQPRPCRDCLQRDGCMVSGFTCRSAEFYSKATDFTRVGANGTGPSAYEESPGIPGDGTCFFSGSLNVSFLSISTSYCATTDSACAKSHIGKANSVTIDTDIEDRVSYYVQTKGFCRGVDNCVCIGGCEDPLVFSEFADLSHCKFATVRENVTMYNIYAITMVGVGISIAFLYFWAKDVRRRINRNGRDQASSHPPPIAADDNRSYMLDVGPAVHLDLYGWRRFHHEILRKEQELLAGAGDVSPVAGPVAFEFAAIPTAPELDEDEESTAPTITNPHALASAPVFRLQAPGSDGMSSGGSKVDDPAIPSAPDFETGTVA